MRRWWVTLALLVSLGVNLGLLGAIAAGRWAGRERPVEEPPPVALPGAGREVPGELAIELPAQPGAEGRGMPTGGTPHGPPLGLLADHLGLSGARRERFIALQRRFLGVHLEARRERALLGRELRRELAAAEPDRARVEELLGRLGEAHAASERATAEVVLDSRELLDADQQRAYFRFLEHLRAGHPGGHRPGRPHRPRSNER